MGAQISYSGTPVNFYFQPWDTGNTGGVKQVNTSIINAGQDIANILSPRDNKASNGAVATGAIFTNSSIPGQKIDIAYLFNKTGSTIDFTVGGTATYTGSVTTTGITFTGQLPTGNDLLFSPTFAVPNPTVDTTSTTNTTCSAVGAYGGPFTVVATQSPPNTTYYTVQSVAFAGGSLVLILPGNYANGTISGSFTINPPPGTLVRPSTPSVSGTGTPRWVGVPSPSPNPAYFNLTDITYGDKSTYSTVDGTSTTSLWLVTGLIPFASQAYTTSATLYIQYGLLTYDYTGFGPSTVTGSLSYSVDGGSTYTTIASFTQSTINFSATPFSVTISGSGNLNQIIVRIISRQSAQVNFYNNAVFPTVYDVFIAYT